MTLVASLLPDGVVCGETADHGEPDDLYPEELAVVAGAVAKRRREFASARRCARSALARLGLPPVPILPGERGAPGWPAGIVGSLTHATAYSAAAVAFAARTAAVGIDVEEHGPLSEGVLGLVARDDELPAVRGLLARRPGVPWDRLVFSAKESVYKAWYPLTGRWLDFDQVRVGFSGFSGDPGEAGGRGAFTAELLVPGPVVAGRRLARFEGRWGVAGGVVATAVVVDAGRD